MNTGNSFSINAPFVLDMSRQVLGKEDQFNKVLIEKAGELVGQLFRKVLLKKYGPSVYSLLCSQATDDTPGFQTYLIESLKKSKVIINDTYDVAVNFLMNFL